MHFVVFMTYSTSLEDWKEAGILERELAVYLTHVAANWKVTLVSYGRSEDAELISHYPQINILVNRWGAFNWLYSLLLPLLYRKELKTAAIFKTNQMFGAHVAYWCSLFVNVQLVVRQGYDFVEHLKRDKQYAFLSLWFAKVYERLFLNKAKIAIFTAQYLLDSALNRNPDIKKKSFVIPNYLQEELWSPSYSKIKIDSPGTIGFCGRFTEQKNLENLINAAVGLPIILLLIGSGPLETKLRQLSDSLGVSCEFYGRCPQVKIASILRTCDLFVLPSSYEGHPKILIEAMALGIPILAADSPGIRNQISHGVTGYLVPPSVDGLRSGIETMLAMSALERENLGRESREFSIKTYSLPRIGALERRILTNK